MKNVWMSIFTFAMLLITGMTTFSCESDTSDDPVTTTISDEEVLAIVSGTLTTGTEGITAEAEEMAYVADAVLEKGPTALSCGETADSTFTRNLNEGRLTALYENYLFWGLNCNENDLPTSIFFGRQMTGDYETERLISDDEATSDWLIESLLLGPNYIFNGRYERTGTQESKVRDMHSFNSTVIIEIEDLNIDKGEKRIASGIATFNLSGTINSETTFSQEGTIVFLGDGAANIVINGNTYTVDLY